MIQNIASIKFDYNDWILAPMDSVPIVSIVDAESPSSEVLDLPDTSQNLEIEIQWVGADESGGSGIADYSVYCSVDSGPFTLWTIESTATSAEFVGENHHTYSFYSIARDKVGHVESIPVAPDASTVIDYRIVCGDANGNGVVNLTDVVYIVNWIFLGGPAPVDGSEGDYNCNGRPNIGDAVYMVNFRSYGAAPCSACP